jgi:hypothetical protein
MNSNGTIPAGKPGHDPLVCGLNGDHCHGCRAEREQQDHESTDAAADATWNGAAHHQPTPAQTTRDAAVPCPFEELVPLGTDYDAPEGDTTGKNQLPTIRGNKRQLRHATDDALDALLALNDPPSVFQRGNVLARLRTDSIQGPYLEALTEHAMRGRLARVANWVVTRELKDGTVEEDAPPPMDVVKDLVSLPSWDGIPLIDRVVECPVFTADGELILQPGYNAGARVWYHQDVSLKSLSVPDRPTKDEVSAAVRLLLGELIGQFPFADEASKAHTLTAVLNPIVRPLIDGPTPLHLIDAPTPGTGKGLLVDVLAIPSTRRAPSVMPEYRNDDEARKNLTSILLKANTFLLFDNLKKTLDSPVIAAALTALVWGDRLLGINKTAVLPVNCTWLATGNNIKVSGELVRRSVWSRMDAKLDRPWLRTGWKHPNLRVWAKENRAQLLGAVLTLVRAWIVAGKPKGTETLGSFESWCEVMGGILQVAGVPGLLSNAGALRRSAVDQDSEWQSFVVEWWKAHKAERVGVRELFMLATGKELLDRVLDAETPRAQRTRLGATLRKLVGRVIGKYRIVDAEEDNSGRKLYRLEKTEAGKPAVDTTPLELDMEGEEPAETGGAGKTREWTG